MKDYYLVLGVARSENAGGIRQAFLELAKRYRSDRTGPGGTPRLQEIQEAYDVLFDPDRRRLYHHGLTRRDAPGGLGRSWSDAMSLSEFLTVRPSVDALWDRLRRDVAAMGIPKGARPEPLNVDIILSREEAMRGQVVRLDVPAFYPCPGCGGSGRIWLFLCVDCVGRGLIEGAERVDIWVPPMTRHDTILEASIPGRTNRNLFLRAHLRIAG